MGDSRITINIKTDFIPVLETLQKEGKPVSILYEDAGVTRGEGVITAVGERDGQYWFSIDTLDIRVADLYAVNGLFSADYSEC